MQLRIFTEPQQGASYEQLLAVASTAETAGFDGFFRSDHYLKMGEVSGLPGPTHAWVTLAGLARDTSTIRLGTLVSPATFDRPGPLAIMVAQVDAMSGGRVDFGFGTGWYGEEHDRYGLEFPPLGTRFDLMEEYLEQMTGLWATPDGETFTHEGRFHRFHQSPALPKPTQRPGPPIIIGGRGPNRTPALVARFAAEYNLPFADVDDTAAAMARIRQACTDAGRAPDDLVYSVALVLCLGADEATMNRRAAAIGREPAELRANGAAGTVDEVVAKLAAYAELGCTRAYLQVLDLTDLDQVLEAGAALIPAAAALN
ncbi:MAG: LLM class F420-dependent oxidoreductase [Acidimicrobiales bacterium]